MEKRQFNPASALFASFVGAIVMAVSFWFIFHKCLLLTLGTNGHMEGLAAYLLGGALFLLVTSGYGLLYARFFQPWLSKLPGFLAGALYSLLPFCIAMLLSNPFLQTSNGCGLQNPLPKAKKMETTLKQTSNRSSQVKMCYPCCALPGGCCIPCGPCNPSCGSCHPALYGCAPSSCEPCSVCGPCGPCGPADFCGPCLSSFSPLSTNPKTISHRSSSCIAASLDRPDPCRPSPSEESSCSPCAAPPFQATPLPSDDTTSPKPGCTPSVKPIPKAPKTPCAPAPSCTAALCKPSCAPMSSTPPANPNPSAKKPMPPKAKSTLYPKDNMRQMDSSWISVLIVHVLYGTVLGALYRPKKTPVK